MVRIWITLLPRVSADGNHFQSLHTEAIEELCLWGCLPDRDLSDLAAENQERCNRIQIDYMYSLLWLTVVASGCRARGG